MRRFDHVFAYCALGMGLFAANLPFRATFEHISTTGGRLFFALWLQRRMSMTSRSSLWSACKWDENAVFMRISALFYCKRAYNLHEEWRVSENGGNRSGFRLYSKNYPKR